MGLCDDCKVLEFDEKDHGGYLKENEEGEEVLWFDADSKGLEGQEVKIIQMKYRRDVTLPDLDSMVGVCEFCSVIRQGLLQKFHPHRKFELRELWYEWGSGRLQCLMLRAWIPGKYEHRSFSEPIPLAQPAPEGYYQIRFDLFAEPDNCAGWLGIERRTIPEDFLSSERTVSTMKKWMALDAMEESSAIPTRLIDVSPTDDAVRCRLVHTADGLQDSGPIKYAALSHCWGDGTDPPPKTTKAKMQLWQREGFSDKDLPATYQDAVKTVRSLDIKYLWIDSLCIVQDDVQDWEREAVKMSEIYQGAAVTIVPIASKSCHDGFSKRSPAPTAGVRHSSSLKPGLEGKYFLREPDFVPQAYFYFAMEQGSTWNTRGWTFQEGMFAVKAFYFGQQKMLFESHGVLWAEDDPQRMAVVQQYGSFGFSIPETKNLKDPKNRFIYHWYYVITNYTERKLSFESDRLPAFSSYAKAFADITGCHYLAGLWREKLHQGLLWQTTPMPESKLLEFVSTTDGALTGTGCAQFTAPSWSWARGSGPVHYKFSRYLSGEKFPTVRRETLEAVMLDAGVEVDGLNEFGRVSSGYIRVSGKVRRLSEMTGGTQRRNYKGSYKAKLNGKTVARCWTDWIVPVKDKLWMKEFPQEVFEGILMLLLVPLIDDSQHCKIGLGLLLLPTEKAGIYRRVGLFESLDEYLFEFVEFQDVTII